MSTNEKPKRSLVDRVLDKYRDRLEMNDTFDIDEFIFAWRDKDYTGMTMFLLDNGIDDATMEEVDRLFNRTDVMVYIRKMQARLMKKGMKKNDR